MPRHPVFVALALSCFAIASTAAAKQKIAVLDIQTEGVQESLGPTLTEILSAEIEALGSFEVIAGSDINALLGFENQKDALGCDDASCIAELGGALGVDKLVVGSVGKVGETYVLNLKLLNIQKAKTEKRVYKTLKKVDELIVTVRASVKKMFDDEEASAAAEPQPKAEPTPKPKPEPQPEPTQVAAAEPAPTPASTSSAKGGIGTGPIVLWSIGGVGVVVGLIAGIRAQSLADQTDPYAPEYRGPDLDDKISAGKTAQVIANIGWGVGLASAGAGFLLWMLSDSDDAVSVGPWLEQPGATVSIRY